MLITKRLEPRFDWALESLKNQTFKDFEYIIVDGYWHRRKLDVKALVEKLDIDFPVMHIPEKLSRWQGQRSQISNARNTGLIFANGEYIVHCDDECKMPEDWLEKHLSWLEQGYFVAGSWIGYQSIAADGSGIEGVYGPEYRIKEMGSPNVTTAAWFYCGNCAYPINPVLDINGFDEEYDGEIGQEDLQLGIRLERTGLKMIFDPTILVGYYMMDHHYEKLIPPVNKELEDGTLHFSNEWLTERLLNDLGRVMPYGTSINITGARALLKENKYSIEQMYNTMKNWINPDKHDWRDGMLINEKLEGEDRWE